MEAKRWYDRSLAGLVGHSVVDLVPDGRDASQRNISTNPFM